MFTLQLTPIFKLRGIEQPYSYLTKNGFTHYSASKILSAKPKSISFKHLSQLCELLICSPKDILLYEPKSSNELTKDHPLNNWKVANNHVDFSQLVATYSVEELRQLADELVKRKKE